jgi:membrane-bound lytic murein transglycosylase F
MIARPHVGSYFLHRGDPRGFEYELLQRFAQEQGLALEIVTPPDAADLTRWLLGGRGDLLAASPEGPLVPTNRLRVTRPVAEVELVLVGRDDDPRPVRKLADLAGRTLVVRHASLERSSAEELAAAVEGLQVEVMPEGTSGVDLLAGVGDGRYDLALCPSHLVRVEQAAGRRLDVVLELGPMELAWGVRASNPQLRAALDEFLAREYRGSAYNVLWRKYLRGGAVLALGGARSDRTAPISPYDAIARRYAAEHDLDWRLVVSVMYQESRFELGRVSAAGAAGLMQVLPETAAELGAGDLHDPAESIRLGTAYLRRLVGLYDPSLPLATRLRFALASYSAGPGHVMDARKLAREIGLSPDRWYGNVERAMLLLEQPEYAATARCGPCRGSETVRYVSEVDRRYRLYVQHVPAEPREASPGGQDTLSASPASPLPPA